MRNDTERLLFEIEKVISGKRETIERVFMAMLAGGHILLDDTPGVGKTTLAVALGKAMQLASARIQCTPDVLPSDIVGYSVYDKQTGNMKYKPGVVNSANLLLCDEINRTSSKTQSALLEAMEERQVTVDGATYPLKEPFIVIATQNHVGSAGTQLLPYAQLDRFMVSLTMGYPDVSAQVELLRRRQNGNPMESLEAVFTMEEFRKMRQEVQEVTAKDSVLDYIARLTINSRTVETVQTGLSPRAALHLDKMAKACAYLHGRDYVVPEDVQAVFTDVGRHRILITSKARMSGITPAELLQGVLKSTTVPDWTSSR